MSRPYKQRVSMINECIRWASENLPKDLPDHEKLEQITLYAMARFYITKNTAREYAQIVLARSKIKLPEAALTDYEIMKAREEASKQKEEQELRSKWGQVAEVEEDIPQAD